LPEFVKVATDGNGDGDRNARCCANYAASIYLEAMSTNTNPETTEYRPNQKVVEDLMKNRHGELDNWIRLIEVTLKRSGDHHSENLKRRGAAVLHWGVYGAEHPQKKAPQVTMRSIGAIPLLVSLLSDPSALAHAAGAIRWCCTGMNKENQDAVGECPDVMDKLVRALDTPEFTSYAAAAIAEVCHGHEANIKRLSRVPEVKQTLEHIAKSSAQAEVRRDADIALGELRRAPFLKSDPQ